MHTNISHVQLLLVLFFVWKNVCYREFETNVYSPFCGIIEVVCNFYRQIIRTEEVENTRARISSLLAQVKLVIIKLQGNSHFSEGKTMKVFILCLMESRDEDPVNLFAFFAALFII